MKALQTPMAALFFKDLTIEVERGLLRSNGLAFPLIKNEYIYIKPKT